jgi:thiol:disulfide interchange protein DsbD
MHDIHLRTLIAPLSARVRESSALLVATLVALMSFLAPAALIPAATAQEEHVSVRFVADRTAARPGDQLAIAIVMEIEEGWHTHTNDPKPPASWKGFRAIPTVLTVGTNAPDASPGTQPIGLVNARVGPEQWPAGTVYPVDLGGTGKPEPYAMFSGVVVGYVPVIVDANATGSVKIPLSLSYQACDDKICTFPITFSETVEIPIATGTDTATRVDPSLYANFKSEVFAQMLAGTLPSKRLNFNVLSWEFSIDPAGPAGLALLLGLAFVGGFLLNLTPCVLPVLPLKIMSLAHSAGQNRGRTLFLGLIMSAGVVAFWIFLATLMVSLTQFKAINQLFQMSWFPIAVGAFIAIMAVGMLGLFSFQLPGMVYLVDPKKDSASGSFVFGIMTAILSTPCTAPLMGTAAAWSVTQPKAITLATLGSIGAGMALPYLVLAAFPQLVSRVPRTGRSSEIIKQVLGLLMLGVAAFFLGTGLDPFIREPIDPATTWYWWAAFVCVAMAAGWILINVARSKGSLAIRGFWAVVAIALAGTMLQITIRLTDKGPVPWVAYTPERYDEARKAGKVVVLKFTATWCLNCHALENTVFRSTDVVALMQEPGVVPMKVDLTGDNQPGNAKLKELNWVGIPYLSISGPGLDQPIGYDNYTPRMVIDAVGKAKGTTEPLAASQAP